MNGYWYLNLKGQLLHWYEMGSGYWRMPWDYLWSITKKVKIRKIILNCSNNTSLLGDNADKIQLSNKLLNDNTTISYSMAMLLSWYWGCLLIKFYVNDDIVWTFYMIWECWGVDFTRSLIEQNIKLDIDDGDPLFDGTI